MLSTLILLQSLPTYTCNILRVQYQLTRVAILTACLIWFYCYTVPVECFLMAESLLVQIAGYDVPQWSERHVVRLDVFTDETPLTLMVATVEAVEVNLMNVLSNLPWQRLRTVAKSLGLTLRTKAAILTALTEEVDRDKVLAYLT